MSVNKEQGPQARDYSRCQIAHSPGKSPSSSCAEAAKEKVDGLPLCERHALEAKLEGQIECWGEMLFHIDLWSREAARREREDVVGLLEDQRIEATSARQKAYADLDVLRSSQTPWERTREPPTRRGSLLLLPQGGAQQLSGEHRRLRRR